MNKSLKWLAALTACAGFSLVALYASCKSEKNSYESDNQTPNNVHTHTYDESRWVSDGDYHWYAATCGHGVKKSYAKHDYDDERDPYCNTCGYEREIKEEEPPVIPDLPPEEEPEEKPETPPEISDIPQESPVVCLRLKDGKTAQFSSGTDKMSAGWTFVGVRENGETVELTDGDVVVIPPLDTTKVGTRTVAVSCGEISGEVEYTIFAVPEYVKNVDIRLKDFDATVEEGAFKLGAEHFEIDITADMSADILQKEVTLECGGAAGSALELLPDESPYTVTVRVDISYEVEGDIILRTFKKAFEITVKKSEPTQPEPAPDDGKLIMDGASISDLSGDISQRTVLAENENGKIFIDPQENFKFSAQNGDALCAEYTGVDYESFFGVGFQTDRAVTVTVHISASEWTGVGVIDDSYFDSWEYVSEPVDIGYEGVVTFTVTGGGTFYLNFYGGESGMRINIHSVQLDFN